MKKNIKNSAHILFFIFFFAVLLSSCKQSVKVSFDRVADDTPVILDSTIVFAGITSIDQVTDSTLRINWTPHAEAISYKIYDATNSPDVLLATVPGQASSIYSLNGLTPAALYKFKVRAVDSLSRLDINTTTETVTTDTAPAIPSAVALISPSSTPSLVGTPTLRVSGVKSGDVIKVFTDNLCTTQVASGTASGTTIDLTTSNIAPGSYSFYANSSNVLSNASACSSATVAYVRNACPTDFILVPFNTSVGTTADFCVAKYEMKCVGSSCPTDIPGTNSVATSQSSGAPWVDITQLNSITACSNLNAINGVTNKYDLITNREWMTIVRNVENVASNWTSGVAGSGVLARGWTNTSNTTVAPSTGAGCLYNTAANTCAAAGTVDLKRTHTLSNGEVIWDLSGNVWEWVNWQVPPANKAHIAANPINTDQGWKDFKDLDTKITSTDEMRPSTWQSTFLTATRAEGLGGYYAGINTTGGAALRGGNWLYGINAGIFTLNLANLSSNASSGFGFRCAYHP